MIFERTINFEPVSLKRHRHRLKGGTYDPSKKDKDDFIKAIQHFPIEKMTKPIICILHFYCKRPKNHYKTGKNANVLKDSSPKYNVNNKDLDNYINDAYYKYLKTLGSQNIFFKEIYKERKSINNT